VKQIQTIKALQTAALAQRSKSVPAGLIELCNATQECVGWGVDITSGSVAGTYNVLEIEYTEQRTSANFFLPDQVDYNPTTKIVPIVETEVFQTIDYFTQYMNKMLSGGNNAGRIGAAGSYGDTFASVLGSLFQLKTDTGPTITTATVVTGTMTLLTDPKGGFSNMHLNVSCCKCTACMNSLSFICIEIRQNGA
jgi:hypothetical protein